MDDCIFCKIVRGEIPSYKLYEDEYTLCFLDAFPGTKGHTLIIPKQHYQDIYDTPDEVYHQIITTGLKVAKSLKSALDCEGMNLLQNTGRVAGQTVFHIHVHLFPRWAGDEALGGWTPSEPSPEEFKQLQDKILPYLS